MSFSIKLVGRTIQIKLDGSIDLSVTNEIKSQTEQIMSSDVTSVTIDAHELDYIDSSGVASLLFVRKLCTRFGSTMVVESISESAARVIQLANLDTVLGLPRATSPSASSSASQSHFSAVSPVAAPKFSDADAMAIFKNDAPVVSAPKNLEPSGSLEIKPPSFS